ncbi:hypothetical protein WJX77_008371 [Trebouxia sp. C0004]
MSTPKKVKMSDEPVPAEPDSQIFQALDQVQQKLDQITDQRSDEILAVERRYNEIRRPVYLERNTLMREVPDLWLQCLLQHQQISELVSERDTDILSYLEEVDVEDFPDIKSGYKITFSFKQNPFFKNSHLVKELHYADDNALAIKGTDIDWTEEGSQHQEQAHQELVNGRKRRAEEPTSMFDWFWESGDVPEGNEPISDLIKDELWTNPMRGSTEDTQNGDGVEAGSEENAGMYAEGQYAEQYEYRDDPAGQEGAEGDADNDPQDTELQGSDMQTDVIQQDEDDLATGDLGEEEGDPAEAGLEEGDLGDTELADGGLTEGDLTEGDLTKAAEGNDDLLDDAEAPTECPSGDGGPSPIAEEETVATTDTTGVPISGGIDDKDMQKSAAGLLLDESPGITDADASAAQKA